MKRTWLVTLSTPMAMMACGNLSTEQKDESATAAQREERAIESFQQAVDSDDTRTMGERAADAANSFGETSKEKLEAAKSKATEAWESSKGTTIDAYNAAVSAAKDVFESGRDKSKSAAEKTADTLKDAKDAAADKASDAKDAASDAKDKAADKAHSRGREMLDTAVERAYAARDRMGEWQVEDFAGETAQRVADDLYDAEEALHEQEQDRADQILHEADSAYDSAHAQGETALDRAGDAASDAAEDAADTASSATERAKQSASDAGSYMRRKGRETSDYVKHNAARARDNFKNHEETFRQKNIDTFNKAIETAKAGADTALYGSRVVTTPVTSTLHFTADRFKNNALWAKEVASDAIAWERSRRTWVEKKIVRGSATVSGYLAGLFTGGVQGAKNKSKQAAAAVDKAAADSLSAASDKLDRAADKTREAAKKTDDAAKRTDPTEDYSSIGLKDVPDGRMGFALGVELFADRICDGLRDKRQLNADETAECLNRQRGLYAYYYDKSVCRENGFRTDVLSDCLALAPQTAGGAKGESSGYTAPFKTASYQFYFHCAPKTLCAP